MINERPQFPGKPFGVSTHIKAFRLGAHRLEPLGDLSHERPHPRGKGCLARPRQAHQHGQHRWSHPPTVTALKRLTDEFERWFIVDRLGLAGSSGSSSSPESRGASGPS
jgi:hypothetical protein